MREYSARGKGVFLQKKVGTPAHFPLIAIIRLFPDVKSSDDSPVTLDIGGLEIVQKSAPLTDHLEQAAAGMIVLLVLLKMSGEVIDALSEESDLNLGRAGVTLMQGMGGDDLVLAFLIHFLPPI